MPIHTSVRHLGQQLSALGIIKPGTIAERRIAVAFAMVFLAWWFAPAWAERIICATGNSPITAISQSDQSQACQAVRESMPFFASVGLKMPKMVEIRLVGSLAGQGAGEHELARYDGNQCFILMLEYDAARAAQRRSGKSSLQVPMNRALWRSYVVHELTHAAIHAGCGQICPDRATHEYIAAVAQLASQPASLRSEILGHHRKLGAFGKETEISEIYYALNPGQFAVKSYLHYLQPGNGPAFVRRLLESPTHHLGSD